MPNAKTHFITGAVIGATVNLTIQIAQMAMDYDRPFDWNESFLCAGAGAFAANPKGIASFCPGLRGWQVRLGPSYPGINAPNVNNPERVASAVDLAIVRPFFHTLLSAALVAWAISGNHTLKLSRTIRLALWAFGISHLSHIALDSTTSGLQSKIKIQPPLW